MSELKPPGYSLGTKIKTAWLIPSSAADRNDSPEQTVDHGTKACLICLVPRLYLQLRSAVLPRHLAMH